MIVGLENQSNDSGNDHAELEQFFPCNHNRHPLSKSIGGKKKYSPPKEINQGSRLPGYWRYHGYSNTYSVETQGKDYVLR